jgi:hypothetical protein
MVSGVDCCSKDDRKASCSVSLSVLEIHILKQRMLKCMLCLSLRLLKKTSHDVLSSSEISTFQILN